eukprot:GILI01012103.1.p1 GENE.GILI01012103.1~~GILI01012103.1.p1  ORF type:complete len:350 (-),score=96.98 GILI01012103.1:200-1249(-)
MSQEGKFEAYADAPEDVSARPRQAQVLVEDDSIDPYKDDKLSFAERRAKRELEKQQKDAQIEAKMVPRPPPPRQPTPDQEEEHEALVAPDPAAQLFESEEQRIKWKRDFNIRQREARWRAQQEEILLQKRMTYELDKLEKANRIAAAKEDYKRQLLEAKVKSRQVELENEYMNRVRGIAISRKEERRREQEGQHIKQLRIAMLKERQQLKDRIALAKAKRRAAFLKASMEKWTKQQVNLTMNARRALAIKQREEERKQRELERIGRIMASEETKRQAKLDMMTRKETERLFQEKKAATIKEMLKKQQDMREELAARREMRARELERSRQDREVARIQDLQQRRTLTASS